ncbi:GNAT family protein [uncultured Clostridium sp.]|jgi:RimJ/RimL family protein N-acetyltransferase|uniref:GNAT family N-acetyltransferase n=1 Tax=uncultured Clostridium sp. TaxID=59620 RepID=UPI003458318B
MIFTGSKVALRGYSYEDIVVAHKFVNDYEITKNLALGSIFPVSLDEEEEFIRKSCARSDDMTCNFAIESLEDGEYIGGCGINETDLKNRNCTVGIFIGEKELWGQGYGTDAMEVLIQYAFNELNFEKIKLSVYSFNSRAIKCYANLGFVEEGQLKKEIFREGKYHDVILMAMFREDYC